MTILHAARLPQVAGAAVIPVPACLFRVLSDRRCARPAHTTTMKWIDK